HEGGVAGGGGGAGAGERRRWRRRRNQKRCRGLETRPGRTAGGDALLSLRRDGAFRPAVLETLIAPRIVMQPRASHVASARQILSRALSGGYWARLGSVYAQLAAYRGACYPTPSWTTTVVLYVAAHLERGLLPSTLLNYANTAVSTLRRMGVEVGGDVLISDLRRALGKMGARRPTRQALTISEEDLWAAVRAEQDAKVRLVLVVMWCAAG
ncbi:hypothetical protein DIPPA_17562, partial [Diplonema papillatum]